jgi:type IV pilus assembly protein PilA
MRASVMKKNRKDSKRARGFTLIELILVLGLVTTLGALAAPQFTDVFDHSKDKADIAQMDQLLAAFQLEQAPFYEGHNGDYDLLNDENVSYVREDGKIVDTIVDPVKAKETLQAFLDNVVKPGSDVYMEGAKCVKTEKTHVVKNGKQRSVFEAKLTKNNTCLKIICRADKNESSIGLPLPGLNKPIDDVYSDGEMVNGTWMIIGDDDRLRADYVEDYLKKKDQKTKEKLDEELKKNEPYKYRTTFIIETEMQEKVIHQDPETNIQFGEDWIVWAPKDKNGIAHTGMKKGKSIPEDIGVRYEFDGEVGILDGKTVSLKVQPNGKTKRIVFWFSKEGEKTLKRAYDLDIPKWNLPMITVNEGYIQCKDNNNPHIFHYRHWGNDEYVDENSSGTSGNDRTIEYPIKDFYTGFILNINQSEDEKNRKEYINYDFLALHYNESKAKTELMYLEKKGNGNTYTQIGDSVELDNFQYNHEYTLELNATKEKAVYVTLYDQNSVLLESKKMDMGNNTLRHSIGYYMNQEILLKDKHAVVKEDEQLPLVSYVNGGSTGPRFILLGMPEFYPYETESETPPDDGGGDQNPDPGEPDEPESKPGLVEFKYDCENRKIELDSKNDNSMEYKWVYNLNYEGDNPNQSDDLKVSGECEDAGLVSCMASGWLYARDRIDGKGIGQWYKTPWVNINDYTIELVSTEINGKPDKQKISFNPAELPNNFNWYIKGLGAEKEGHSIRVRNVHEMNEIDVQAYVKWNDKQVSTSRGESFGYNSFNESTPFHLEVSVISENGKDQYRIDVKANAICTIQYTLKSNGKLSGNASESISDSEVDVKKELVGKTKMDTIILTVSVPNKFTNTDSTTVSQQEWYFDKEGWHKN